MAVRKNRMSACGAAGILLLARIVFPPVLAAEGIREGDVKAAFVLSFIKFVEWPAPAFHSPDDPILLYVFGNDTTADALPSLDGKIASGRRMVVQKVRSLASVERCQVLYIGATEKDGLEQIFDAVSQRPVLMVADFEGFADRGGAIGFTRQDNRVGFEINEEAARKAGLKVNAKLLYLGKSIRGRQGGKR